MPSESIVNIEPASENSIVNRAKHQKSIDMSVKENTKKTKQIEVNDPEFYKLEKHVFIITFAGKPVFSRYGDENSLAPFMGVCSTIVTLVTQFDDDSIGAIIGGDYKFVFLIKGPLYYVCASRTSETIEQLKNQLRFIHYQLTALLTSQVYSMLEARPQYELRNLIGPTDRLLLQTLIDDFNQTPAYMLNSYTPLSLRK
eukprot:UN28621